MLHVHSYYSFLAGTASPSELIGRAAQLGMPALALTDHNTMTGAVEFFVLAKESGIHPILGLETDVYLPPLFVSRAGPSTSPGGSLVLLAMNMQGWANLCRLSSDLNGVSPGEEGKPLSFERLSELSGGLICLTGGSRGWLGELVGGPVGQARDALARLHEVFPGRLYLEVDLSHPEAAAKSRRLLEAGKRLGLPAVVDHPVYYLEPGGVPLQRLMAAIRLTVPLANLPHGEAAPPGSHFAAAEEVEHQFAETFPDQDIAPFVTWRDEIVSRCRLDLPIGQRHYPQIDLPEEVSPAQALRQKAEEGARELYGARLDTPVVRGRLDHELAVIEECGYASLFLIMADILDHARRIGVPISSRGSAASSLVAHCLGITSPDPIRLNLYFERFLNPARKTPPDIDTDLCSRRRDEVIRYVYERYGSDRVAMVCTIQRFRSRSALREAAKALGFPADEIKLLADSLPRYWWVMAREGGDESPFAELEERFTSPQHRQLFAMAKAMIGLPRHLSVHPGGVVIAPGRLTDLVPLQLAAKGVVITQFDHEVIERVGLIKMDMLGIRGLTVLGDTAQAIYAAEPARYDGPLRAVESIPLEDEPVADAIEHGRTIGCFQIESPGMRATLKEIHARTVDDIMAALALYRPGPLTGGLKDAFVRRHRGLEKAEQLHTALEPLLADTYGVILYQEQVLRIANELAGFSLSDSDLLRRAMSHFDPGKQMQALKDKFIRGASDRAGVPVHVSERVWELMAAFAGYGFPKAHAASYAVVGWRLAWCKLHYPAIFMAAVLANWGGYYGQRVYLTESRRMGLSVRPPHVNYSRREFTPLAVDGQTALYMGLDQVRDLTGATIAKILRLRPFHSLADFVSRVDPRKAEVENLIRSGGFSGLGGIPDLLQQLATGAWSKGQMQLFSLPAASSAGDWSLSQVVAAEEEILGAAVSAHPLELLAAQITSAAALTTVEAAAQIGKRVVLAGMRQTWRRVMTARGEPIYFMSLEDLEGMLNVVISSDVYRRCRTAFSTAGPYLIEGEISLDEVSGEPFVRCSRCEAVTAAEKGSPS